MQIAIYIYIDGLQLIMKTNSNNMYTYVCTYVLCKLIPIYLSSYVSVSLCFEVTITHSSYSIEYIHITHVYTISRLQHDNARR